MDNFIIMNDDLHVLSRCDTLTQAKYDFLISFKPSRCFILSNKTKKKYYYNEQLKKFERRDYRYA